MTCDLASTGFNAILICLVCFSQPATADASFFACGKEIASYMELVLSEEFSSRRRLGHT